MMNSNPMKDALKRRKMQGMDVTISIAPADESEKDSDLAPASHEGQESPMAEAMEEQAAPDEMGDLEELTGGMTDHDKQMAMEPGRKPLSLGERARMEALAKMKQGK